MATIIVIVFLPPVYSNRKLDGTCPIVVSVPLYLFPDPCPPIFIQAALSRQLAQGGTMTQQQQAMAAAAAGETEEVMIP